MKGLDWLEKVHFTAEDTLFVGFHGVGVKNKTAIYLLLMLLFLDLLCGP